MFCILSEAAGAVVVHEGAAAQHEGAAVEQQSPAYADVAAKAPTAVVASTMESNLNMQFSFHEEPRNKQHHNVPVGHCARPETIGPN
jgi:hypothetical protein